VLDDGVSDLRTDISFKRPQGRLVSPERLESGLFSVDFGIVDRPDVLAFLDLGKDRLRRPFTDSFLLVLKQAICRAEALFCTWPAALSVAHHKTPSPGIGLHPPDRL
jgi:hypothetical protein